LRAILEEVLLDTMYDLPGRTDVAKVVIDEDCVTHRAAPKFTTRSPRVSKPKRAAS
jgi:ATP-dependent Clp protease ATP-binding subunit ClpX